MSIPKKQFRDAVYDFLTKRRTDDPLKYTHLSYGFFNGKFSIKSEDHKNNLKLCINAINNGVDD
jgi:hypothetical protein